MRQSYGKDAPACPQQHLRLLEVRGVKALGKPAIDRCWQRVYFSVFALLLPQARQAHSRPQHTGLQHVVNQARCVEGLIP